ncbi:hypothetical protein NQ317_011119 [Molorchus minor]|uniref:Uncharacterized protein n=1 Tax=Molorchus minor TaxID=1323400 RepID=A0ABQ9K1P7_9CUCU|nr:hypothetical protein NQ317_011119 [Molorchus minor]
MITYLVYTPEDDHSSVYEELTFEAPDCSVTGTGNYPAAACNQYYNLKPVHLEQLMTQQLKPVSPVPLVLPNWALFPLAWWFVYYALLYSFQMAVKNS